MRIRYDYSSRMTRTIDPHNKHRRSFTSQALEVIRISDVILYILDARFIDETRNRELEKVMNEKDKIVITILNKSDLVNISKLKDSQDLKSLSPYIFVSTKTLIGRKKLRDQIKIEVKRLKAAGKIFSENEDEEMKEEALKGHKRVIGKTQWLKLTKKAHIGIIGYPNTGKSSVINMLTGRSAAKASAQSGLTKGIQKVKFSADILILDTPGVIEDREYEPHEEEFMEKQGKIGARVYASVKNPEAAVAKILEDYPGVLEKFYSIEANGDVEILIDELGRKKKFMLKGDNVDVDRTARYILKEWQSGAVSKKS